MQKKSQVTAFIVIGLVLLIIVSGLLYLRSNATAPSVGQKEEEVSAGVAPLKIFVQTCLKETAKRYINFNGAQGGYYIAPEKKYNLFYSYDVPFYFYEGQDLVPSIDVWQQQLSIAIKENIRDCLENFTTFKEQGYAIEDASDIIVNSRIMDEEVLVDMNYSIKITSGNAVDTLSSFSTTIPSDLMSYYNLAKSLIETQMKTPTMYPASDFTAMMKDKQKKGYTRDMGNSTIIIHLSGKDTTEDSDFNKEYYLSFGLKYKKE